MSDNERIGLFGGTFNPIHQGHLNAATDAVGKLPLSRLIFIPSANPPHKPLEDETPARHRLEMVRLAVAGNSLFEVSDAEIRRGGESYTLLTLGSLRKKMPGTDFVFLLGIDAYLEIGSWYHIEQVLPLAEWVVMTRPGYARPDLLHPLGSLAVHFQKAGNDLIRSEELQTSIRFLRIRDTAVSSSGVRQALKMGNLPAGWIPDSVGTYIARNRLYQALKPVAS
jgi:nicotinate-nucleotide adenylyltransferase